jgi:hypothetical protein
MEGSNVDRKVKVVKARQRKGGPHLQELRIKKNTIPGSIKPRLSGSNQLIVQKTKETLRFIFCAGLEMKKVPALTIPARIFF